MSAGPLHAHRHDPLLEEMQWLWADAEDIWQRNLKHQGFASYVSADYAEIYRALARLEGQVDTILEWGSGLGVVAIMASRLGFQAYGIEVEPALVEHATELSDSYNANAQFAAGSFIPDDYDWEPDAPGLPSRTDTDSRAAYSELDMEPRDFDLFYAYPWPDEHPFFLDILQKYGRKGALFLCYDAREGISLSAIG
ncbi:MAG: class I SAM-dependent methyltransferase [Planctomycetota bacterium]